MSTLRVLAPLAAALLTLGCGSAPRDETDSASTGLGTDASSGETATASAGGTDDIKLDVGVGTGMTTGDTGPGQGCGGIDFLFVVDRSSSMTQKQQNLVASFPGFVEAIEAKTKELNANNFHILVTDTETIGVVTVDQYCQADCGYNDDGFCSLDGSACAFAMDPSCVSVCRDDIENTCEGGKACHDLLPECGACGCTLGAGRVDDKDGNACGVDGAQRYLLNSQPDLPGTFACLAEVGIQGAKERQVDAIVRALSDEQNDAGGCNAGFLRSDSILVVTLITDEEDGEVAGPGVPEWATGSSGTPQEWYDALVSAKGGDPSAVVMLGLIGDRDLPDPLCTCELNDNNCMGGQAEPSPNLREFVTSFPKHVVGSVCEPTYDGFLATAVDLITTTCEDFVPPG